MARTSKCLTLTFMVALLLTATGCPTYFDNPWGHGKRKATASRPAEELPDVGLEFHRRSLPEFAHGGSSQLFDVDNDGTIEIVTPSMEGQVYILDRTGKGIERVRLQRGRRDLFSNELTPLNLSGATHWLCMDMEMNGGFNAADLKYRVTLYRRDGKRIWQQELGTSGEYAQTDVRCGRLRDKEHHEIVLVTRVMGRWDHEDDDVMSHMKTRVLILDAADGAPLARRTVNDYLTFSAIIPAATPDGVDALILGINDDIVTCTLTGEAASQPAASEPGARREPAAASEPSGR